MIATSLFVVPRSIPMIGSIHHSPNISAAMARSPAIGILGGRWCDVRLSRLRHATLHHGDEPRPLLEHRDVGDGVAGDDQDVSEFAGFQRAKLVAAAKD